MPKPRSRTGPGRPPSKNPKEERSLVRLTHDDVVAFRAECARLTAKTGQEWTLSGYLRVAGRAYLGKHLA